jgi:hypothetical protein
VEQFRAFVGWAGMTSEPIVNLAPFKPQRLRRLLLGLVAILFCPAGQDLLNGYAHIFENLQEEN